jgi:hypothetical protein
VAEPTTAQRKMFAKMKLAMPDGSYYIRNGAAGVSDLKNAIEAVGRGTGDHDAIRKHIITRAGALKRTDMIPDNWNPDGSMKHEAFVDAFLAHYGVKGMQWDHHKPQQDAPFIQRQGQAQQPPSGGQRPQFTPQQRADKMAQLIQLIHASQAKATDESAQEAKTNPSSQATADHAANTAHLAQMAQAAKQATAANAVHKAANAKKPANHPANQAHAAKMTAKAKSAVKAHAAHKAKHPSKKSGSKPAAVKLNAKQKAELAKLSPAQRTALAKLSPHDRAVLAKMTPQQKKALSHLSQKQKDALHKAQLASAAKRHKDALARKAAKSGSSAQHSDPVDDFLTHFGVKGMHWGVRRSRPTSGPSSADHHAVVGLGNKINSHGGIHALSNDELQKVITRLNLEQNYHRLTSEPGNADKGRAFVKKAISDTKLALDAVSTANQVKKAFEDHASAGPKRQSKRTRNAPLRVVSVK